MVWSPRRLPAPRAGDVVWVVDDPQAGPWRLAELTQTLTGPTQVSYLGTVFEVAREGEGVWVRRTPQVLSVVTELLPGRSERLVEATWSVGEQVDRVVGTPEHPFYVAELGWVPLGELTVGMELHTAQGSGALLVGSTWWPEEVADFNLEVAEEHTYFVRGAGVDAVGVLVHNACGASRAPSVDALSEAAGAADKGGLTKAGRAVQKHGDRPGSAFPKATGTPADKNALGQDIVDDILTDPTSTTATKSTGRFGDVTDVRTDGGSGRGVRYDSDGNMIGLLEPD